MAKVKGGAKAPATAAAKAMKGGKASAAKASKTEAKKPPTKATKSSVTESKAGKKAAPPVKAAKLAKPPKITASAAVVATSDDDDLGQLDVVLKTLVGGKASVITDDNGTVYDVKLAKIDLKKNEDKYYIVQAVKDGKKYFCFTRWGRTGTKGQTELKAGDETSVLDLFAKKFKEKTGCSWSDRDIFDKKKDFYDVLKIDHTRAAGPPAVWEYYVDDFVNGMATGWYPYDDTGRDNCEDLWNTYLANKSYSMRIVESGNMGFQYLVNLTKMTQMNVKTMKERHIRRIDGDL